MSDPALEEALYEITSLRAFAHLSLGGPIPDETTILNFRHMLVANDLAQDILKAVKAHLARKGLLLNHGSIVDATIIHHRRAHFDQEQPKANVTARCTKPRRVTSGTSG